MSVEAHIIRRRPEEDRRKNRYPNMHRLRTVSMITSVTAAVTAAMTVNAPFTAY
jgi:hypothetical protein